MIPKGFYNDVGDSRYDFHRLDDLNLPTDFAELLIDQSQKVACLVHQKYLTRKPNGWGFTEDVPSLADQQEMLLGNIFGEKEAFRNQFTPGFGTTFLVTSQLALTAAHCICHEGSGELNTKLVDAARIVFGFHDVKEKRSDYSFSEGQVYTVTVVAYQYFRASGRTTAYSEWTDWALLKLDRKVVTYVNPLSLNFNKVINKIELYMLGHPNGLPLKFTYNGKIEGNTEGDFFECKLAAFRGNSGSPVFNRETKQIEGILIEGPEDYQVVSNYRGTGQTRIQASCITRSEIFSNQIGKRMENCQRLDVLRHLVDKDLLDLQGLESNENASELLVQSLKESYKHRNTINRLLDEPLPIDTIYTELVLLSNNKETDKEKEKKTFEEHRINSWEDIHAVKEPIKLDALFENRDGKSPKRLLILGRAGIGKSTLCQYIANQWAQSKLWQGKFDAVFWVPLRRLQNVHSAETAASALLRLCCQESGLFTKDVRNYLNQNPDRILLVLDGLDEMTLTEGSQQKKILDELLKFPHWILTSRPHAIGSIQADATIENVGYDSKTIDLYIQKSFQDQATTIIQKIRQNPIIFGLCHIPINLELICSILKSSKGDLSKVSSMTSLYEELTLTLQKRFLEKRGKPEAWNWMPLEINQEVDPVFKVLEEIAWNAMRNEQLVFSLEDKSHHLCTSGFLQSTQDSEDVLANEYSFLHLTFQEFFTARYLVNLLKDNPKEASKCIQAVKFDPRYKVVMWFTSGLLRNEGEDFCHLNAFFEMLDTPKDLVGLYGTLLKVRCLEECVWQEKLQKIKFYKKEIGFWLKKMITNKENDLIKKYLIEAFEISPQGARRLFIPKLSSCLLSSDSFVRAAAAKALGQVGYADHKIVILTLQEALKDKHRWVRRAVAKALGQIGQADPESVIPILIEALTDKDEFLRADIVEALGQVGHSDPQAVILLLLETLQDKSERVRTATAKALGQLGHTDPETVILALLQALKDNDIKVRITAAAALGQIGHIKPKIIIPSLLKALKDPHPWVKHGAVAALSQINHANSKVAIPLLIEILNGKSNYLRLAVTRALRQIGHADPNAVMPALLEALNDEEFMIKEAAAIALGQIGHANPKAVIPKLLLALNDEGGVVRKQVAKALGQLGQEDPQTVIPVLLKTLKDNHPWVREAAVEALGLVGKADLNAVIPMLLKALNDKDPFVRITAAKTLGHLGHADQKTFILPMLESIKNGCFLSREHAAKALQKYDLSSYLKSHPNILDHSEDWTTLLTSTPLSSLITCSKKAQSPIFSAAIAKKCIDENLPIFLIDNTLCFCEQGKLCTIDFPNAHQFAIQIEKRVPEYPEFSNGMCTIQ